MFSIVIATRDRPEKLIRAVESVARQTVPPAEVVVVDDGSDPAVSREVLLKILGDIPLKLNRQKSPSGPSAARNQGVSMATGEWVCFLDDDDVFMPEKLAMLKDKIRKNIRADLIFHPAVIHLERESLKYVTSRRSSPGSGIGYKEMLVTNRIGGTPMVSVRRELLSSVKGFDESLPALEDYELWLRLAQRGAKIYAIDQALTECSVRTKETTVSRHGENNSVALDLIRRRHRIFETNLLTASDRAAHLSWSVGMEVNRAILSGNRGEAVSLQVNKLRHRISLFDIVVLLLLFVGPSAVLKVRAKLFPALGSYCLRQSGG